MDLTSMEDKKHKYVLKALMTLTKDDYVLTKDYMKTATLTGVELLDDEQILLDIAYRTVINTYRNTWKVYIITENDMNESQEQRDLIKQSRHTLGGDIQSLCYEIEDLVRKFILPKSRNPLTVIFSGKLIGDYLKIVAEMYHDKDVPSSVLGRCYQAYENAFQLAKQFMHPTHLIRLELGNNYAIFLREILKNHVAAHDVALFVYVQAWTYERNTGRVETIKGAMIKLKFLVNLLKSSLL